MLSLRRFTHRYVGRRRQAPSHAVVVDHIKCRNRAHDKRVQQVFQNDPRLGRGVRQPVGSPLLDRVAESAVVIGHRLCAVEGDRREMVVIVWVGGMRQTLVVHPAAAAATWT